MTSVPQKDTPHKPAPSNPASTVLRVILFAILAYMVFALAYDYLYVFPTHEKKFQALSDLIQEETSRSADARKEEGPNGPEKVQEIMGFAPAVPLEDMGHYSHERYTFRRALPWMTRNIDVYYKQYQGDSTPGIHSVAHSEEDIPEAIPNPPVQPSELEAEPAEEGDEKKSDDEVSDVTPDDAKKAPAEETDDKPAPETPADPPADEPSDEKPPVEDPADDAASADSAKSDETKDE